MTPHHVRRSARLAVAAIAVIAASAARPAHAQFGFGGPFGGFGFNFNYVPSSTGFLYDRANAQAAAAAATRNNVGSAARNFRDSPNAYFNRVRDLSGGATFDVGSRRSLSERSALTPYAPTLRPPSNATAAAPTPPAPPAREAPPIGAFFRADGSIDWPGDAPENDDVASERDEASRALAAVNAQIKADGKAKAGTVGLAKAKLIVYGQKALSYVRAERAPAVADVFHYYLLFLNDALDAAAG